MTEWTVVTVIVVIAGLVATLVKPMLKLNTSMVELTMSNGRLSEDNKRLSEELKGFTSKNSEAHARIWEHEDEQDKQLVDHDKRITRLEDNKE